MVVSNAMLLMCWNEWFIKYQKVPSNHDKVRMHIKVPQGNNLETLCSYSTDEFVTGKT